MRVQSRREQLRRFSRWYKLTDSDTALCVYCGMLATQTDHFPPIAYVPRYGVLLPACGECNRFARDLYPYDFSKRVQHVKNRIGRKYRSVLATPTWCAEELDELSGFMRKASVEWRDEKRITRARLAWDVNKHLRLSVATRNFAAHDADCARIRAFVVSLLKLSLLETDHSNELRP